MPAPDVVTMPLAHRNGQPLTLWHVIPVEDPPEHRQSLTCWCYPTLEPEGAPTMIVHRPGRGLPWPSASVKRGA